MLCRSLAYGFTFTINKELNAIKEWVIISHLSINTVKTQALVIGTSTYKYELWLGDTPVENPSLITPMLRQTLYVELDILFQCM